MLRLRMVTPGTKVALALPLKFGGRVYGTLVLARRENVALTKREKTTLTTNVNFITEELKKAGLFGSSLILGNPIVANEPLGLPAGVLLLDPARVGQQDAAEVDRRPGRERECFVDPLR